MSNTKPTFARRGGTPARDADTAVRQRGYEDRRAGRPFPDAFDTWSEAHQKGYERGRQQAVIASRELGATLAAYLASEPSKAPKWPCNRRLSTTLPPAVAVVVGKETSLAKGQCFGGVAP